jgi:hypothetical protein
MLGIVIGIASVIAMVAIGQGASKQIENQINAMGKNLMMVFPGAMSSGGFSMGSGSVTTLTPEDGLAIVGKCPRSRPMTPVVRARVLQLVSGSNNWAPNTIMGASPAFVETRDWPAEEGAFFSEQDVFSAAKVCVLGRTVAENLFQGNSRSARSSACKNMPFKVVGVLSRKGSNAFGQDQDDVMICPWTTVKMVLQGSAVQQHRLPVRLGRHGGGSARRRSTTSPASCASATASATARRPISGSCLMSEMASTRSETAKTMTLLLTFIALISLLVGGIGIMNIMLGVGGRADARDRPADGGGRAPPGHPAAVPDGGGGALDHRRTHRDGGRRGHGDRDHPRHELGDGDLPVVRSAPRSRSPAWWASSSASTPPCAPRASIPSKRSATR